MLLIILIISNSPCFLAVIEFLVVDSSRIDNYAATYEVRLTFCFVSARVADKRFPYSNAIGVPLFELLQTVPATCRCLFMASFFRTFEVID